MFIKENAYFRVARRSAGKGKNLIDLGFQKKWSVDRSCEADGIDLPGRCVYAQNEKYLELCNPGWEFQWRAAVGSIFIAPCFLFIAWLWYCFAVHPLIFGKLIFIGPWYIVDYKNEMSPFFWGGWLLIFPMALAGFFIMHLWWNANGARTAFFTYARGRIRFNRIQRKVYVLRPIIVEEMPFLSGIASVHCSTPMVFIPMGNRRLKG